MKKMAAWDLWTWLGGFSLDFRLAGRMPARYPLLTIVVGAGMAFGIAAGVGGFEVRRQLLDPALPLDEGRRIVGLRKWDVRNDRPVPTGEADFNAWREQLQSVNDLGAVSLLERNLTVNGTIEPIEVAAITASGFRIARVSPQFGRTLVTSDESPAAPPVAVIGHSLCNADSLRIQPSLAARFVSGSNRRRLLASCRRDFVFPSTTSCGFRCGLVRSAAARTRDRGTCLAG
jgi:hypothetical protein